jgi:hypothetical protein
VLGAFERGHRDDRACGGFVSCLQPFDFSYYVSWYFAINVVLALAVVGWFLWISIKSDEED